VTEFEVPILFLDTDIEENDPQDRDITWYLYGGDQEYRLKQEVVLGIAGMRILRALGHAHINRYHMNEGHASMLALDLLREFATITGVDLNDFAACKEQCLEPVRKLCVFTTHTPVAAGHDRFGYDLVEKVLGDFMPIETIKRLGGPDDMNMTLLALNLSHYVNSVAKKHMDVSRHMFPGYHISFITNGVHSVTWTSDPFAELFDKYVAGWRFDSFELRHVLNIPKHEIWQAHLRVKELLIGFINTSQNAGFDKDVFTIGFARRATAYKRPGLLFHDIARLKAIGKRFRIQLVFAGKAHPMDTEGKELIKQVYDHLKELEGTIKAVYLPEYDIRLAKLLIPGVDLWLNTPERPQEASGTSGMKASHNGVPSLSVLDGWWIEGHNEGVTGWSIGQSTADDRPVVNDDDSDAMEIYTKLESTILPAFYNDQEGWQRIMRNCIALNASFFNTHRMVQQYALKAYLR
jgi:starch phosphorylase